VYIQILDDLHDLILKTADTDKQIRLIQGDAKKNSVGLQHFSSFGKLSYIFNFFEDYNCRIREKTLTVAIDLWRKCDDALKQYLQPIVLSRNEVINSEHTLIKHILMNDLSALEIATHEFKDKTTQQEIKERVADLVQGYCKHKVTELTALVAEQKSSSHKNLKLKNVVDRVQNELLHLAEHTKKSTNQMVRTNSSRIRGDKSKALMLYRESLFHYNKWSSALVQLSKTQRSKKHNADIARCNVTMGDSYAKDGEYKKALECFRKALPELETALGQNHNEVAAVYHAMGQVYLKQRKFDKALDNCNNALAIQLTKDMLTNDADIAAVYNDIACIYIAKGNEFENALKYYKLALDVHVTSVGENHLNVAATYHSIGNIYKQICSMEKALEYFLKEISILELNLGEKHPRLASRNSLVGQVYYEHFKDLENGLTYVSKALNISLNVFGDDHPSIGKLYNFLGSIYEDKTMYNKSLEFYNKTLSILAKTVGHDHIDNALVWFHIGICYNKQRNYIVPTDRGDTRFQDLFSNPDFQIDEASEEFKLSNPSGITAKEIELRKQHGLLPSTETERRQWNTNSDSDGEDRDEDADNNDEDVFSDKRYVNRLKRERENDVGEEDPDSYTSNGDLYSTNNNGEEEGKAGVKKKKKTRLKPVPIHENVELVPGQSVKQKLMKEKRKKIQKSTISDRLKLEEEMIEKANELRKNNANNTANEGVYSITYKPEREKQRG